VEILQDSVLQQYFAGTIKVEVDDFEIDEVKDKNVDTEALMKYSLAVLESKRNKWKSKFYNMKGGTRDGSIRKRKREATQQEIDDAEATYRKFCLAYNRKTKLLAKAVEQGAQSIMNSNQEAIDATERAIKANKEALKGLKRQKIIGKQTLKIATDLQGGFDS